MISCGFAPVKKFRSTVWSSKGKARSMNRWSPASRFPSRKSSNSKVTGGTVNGTGSFLMRAERVGSETLLAQIVRMVSEAQRSRAPIQKLADVVSSYFVPAVVAVALSSPLLFGRCSDPSRAWRTRWSTRWPCSSSPVPARSVWRRRCRSWSAPGAARRAGVLIKNAEALEVLEKVDTVVVDKTGTLTEGKPKLVTVEVVPGASESEVLRLAASLEKASEHPLAAAIVAGAQERGLQLAKDQGFQSYTGKGIFGVVEGKRVALGQSQIIRRAENLTQTPCAIAPRRCAPKGRR